MLDTIFTLLPVFAMLVAPVLTMYIVQGLKRLSPVIDSMAPANKQALVLLVSTALQLAGSALGVTIPTTIDGVTPEVVSAILTGLAAMGLHSIKTSKAQA